jgi:hypothetical protein
MVGKTMLANLCETLRTYDRRKLLHLKYDFNKKVGQSLDFRFHGWSHRELQVELLVPSHLAIHFQLLHVVRAEVLPSAVGHLSI